MLQPALLGSVHCFELADVAAERGIGVVVTHSLDGEIGLAAASALAQALPFMPWSCGQAPHAGLNRIVDLQPWLPLPTGKGLDTIWPVWWLVVQMS